MADDEDSSQGETVSQEDSSQENEENKEEDLMKDEDEDEDDVKAKKRKQQKKPRSKRTSLDDIPLEFRRRSHRTPVKPMRFAEQGDKGSYNTF